MQSALLFSALRPQESHYCEHGLLLDQQVLREGRGDLLGRDARVPVGAVLIYPALAHAAAEVRICQ